MKKFICLFALAFATLTVASCDKTNDDETIEPGKLIERKEEERAAYYNYYTGKRWGDSKSYDLCVNSSLLGKEGTARLISGFVREVISRKKDNCD
jgi:cytidylate kinase